MGGAPGIGNRRTRGDAGGLHARHQIRQHRRLTAMQVVGAGGVDDEPVRWIGRNDRRVAQCPKREAVERRRVLARLELEADEVRNEDLRLARRHADAQARIAGRRIEGEDFAAAALPTEQDDWRISGRRRGAELAPQAIGGPGRQIE